MKRCVIRMCIPIQVDAKWLASVSGKPKDCDKPDHVVNPFVSEVVVWEDGVIEMVTDDLDDWCSSNSEPYDFLEATGNELLLPVEEVMVLAIRMHRVRPVLVEVPSPMGMITSVNFHGDGDVVIRVQDGNVTSMRYLYDCDFGPWVRELFLAVTEEMMEEPKKRMRLVDAAKLADFLRTDTVAIAKRKEITSMQKYCDWLNEAWGVCPVAVGTLQELCDEFGIKIGQDDSIAVDKEAREAVADLRLVVQQVLEILHDRGTDTDAVSVQLAAINL